MSLYRATLREGTHLEKTLGAGRHAWLQVIEGAVEVGGARLEEGDGVTIDDPGTLRVAGTGDWSDLLLFDLA